MKKRLKKCLKNKELNYWNEFKENKWISIGWYKGKDWRKTKFGDLIGGNKILMDDKAKIFLNSGDIRMHGTKKRRS